MSSGGMKLWENDEQAYYMPSATGTTSKVVRKTMTTTTTRKEIRQTGGSDLYSDSPQVEDQQFQQQNRQEQLQQEEHRKRQQQQQQQQQEEQRRRQLQQEDQRKRQQQQQEEQRRRQLQQEEQRKRQQQQQDEQRRRQLQQEEQKKRQQQQQEEQRRRQLQQEEQRKRHLQQQEEEEERRQVKEKQMEEQRHNAPKQKGPMQLWNDATQRNEPQRRSEFIENEQERQRKLQQQESYRKIREDQNRAKLQQMDDDESNEQRGILRQNSKEDAKKNVSFGSTVELKPAPAPLDSDLWPPKGSNMQPLPKTGFYPTEVRKEQEKGPKQFVWPPVEEMNYDDYPAAYRGGVARNQVPSAQFDSDNAWNPQSPGTNRRLPEWAQYKPQRKCADDIWPPKEVRDSDGISLERPGPRKAHHLEYIKRGRNVPVTYHSPPGTQHTSIEGRYPYAT